jgi:xanthine dehydrogenase FAD-binding subunit
MDFVKIFTPSDLIDLRKLFLNIDDNTYLLAGGTDLIIKLNKKEKRFFYNLIDLSGIKDLQYIKEDDKNIYIGSMTTFSQIAENNLIECYTYCLKKAANNVGSVQIRNSATIGGNIANASPAADSIPALLALDSNIKILTKDDRIITLKLNQYLHEYNKKIPTCILEIIIPKKYNIISNFEKLGSRTQVTISKINMAGVLEFDKGKIKAASFSLGAVSRIAVISENINKKLMGKEFNESLKKEFIEIVTKEVEELTKGRASSEYKKEAVKGICEDMFMNLFKQYEKVII